MIAVESVWNQQQCIINGPVCSLLVYDAVVYFISTHSLTWLRTCAISNVPVVSMLAAMTGMPVYVCLELRNV